MQAAAAARFRFLVVTAHPDDEAGGFGGTLALYGRRGADIHVVCLTAGTAARNRGTATSNEELAQMRRAEFAASCAVLGVTGEVLDYPDGALPRTPLEQPVADLVLRIRRRKPHIVLTFGPEGGLTGHADHAMAGVFGSLAFQWAAHKERFAEQLVGGLGVHRAQKLYWQSAAFVAPRWPDVSLPPITATIDVRSFVETKIRAFHQHTTQSPLFERFGDSMARMAQVESFHLASVGQPGKIRLEEDLLDGVTL
jgi:LmbE family N-acetylglucosaminyl deacetylase